MTATLFSSVFLVYFIQWLKEGTSVRVSVEPRSVDVEPRLVHANNSDALSYMMELYEQASRTSDVMSYSNAVHSFESEATINDNEMSAEFKFDVSKLEPSEDVTAAYLRMKLSWRHQCGEEGCEHVILSLSKCSLDDLMPVVNTEISLTISEDVSVEIDVKAAASGWTEQQSVCFMVRLESTSAMAARTVLSSLVSEHLPVVLIYTRDKDNSLFKQTLPHEATPREKRDDLGKRDDLQKGAKNNSCRRVRHYVRFSELKLNVKVVAPSGYYMNMCVGQCSHPLKSTTTTHTRVQQVLERYSHDTPLPTIACAPTKMAHLLMLYFAGGRKFILKYQPDMVVSKCSCCS